MKLEIIFGTVAFAMCHLQGASAASLRGVESLDPTSEFSQVTPISQTDSSQNDPTTTMGSTLLDALEKMRASSTETQEELTELLQNEELTQEEIVNMQMKIAQLTLQQEIASKAANSLSSSIKSLFKNQ